MSSPSYHRPPASTTHSAPLKADAAQGQERSKQLLSTYAQHRANYQFLTYCLYYLGGVFVALGVMLVLYCCPKNL